MFDEYFQASMNVVHLVSEALSSFYFGSTGSSSSSPLIKMHRIEVFIRLLLLLNLQLFLKVLIMTIMILKLHVNNDSILAILSQKPGSEESLSSRIVDPLYVRLVNQPQEHKGKCRLRNWTWNVE